MLSGAFGALKNRLNRGGEPVTTSASDGVADYEDVEAGRLPRHVCAQFQRSLMLICPLAWLHPRLGSATMCDVCDNARS